MTFAAAREVGKGALEVGEDLLRDERQHLLCFTVLR
jgi:hypothetical protein